MRNFLVGIGFACVAGALGVSGCRSGVCTAIGCYDNFSATVKRADGSFPSGSHRVEVLADGASLSCTFTFPLGTVAGGGVLQPACPPQLGISVWPTSGSFVETITLMGAPGQVHVWQYVDDATILDVAAAPSYQESRPNGPECAPVCRQASLSWTLE